MTTTGYRRLVIALCVVSVVLLVATCKLLWDLASVHARVAFASEQTEIFEEQRRVALAADPFGAASQLEYIVGYYPTGTKQIPGSRLDKVVERQRAQAVHDIIAYLRTKTGEDLGDDPQKWIQKYAKR
jgi:hypothetical protein